MSDLSEQVWRACEALESFVDARNEVMRDYTGDGVPDAIRDVQGSLKAGTARLLEVIRLLVPHEGDEKTTKREVILEYESLMPDNIRHAYGYLYSLVYGSSGSFAGDPNAEKIVPKEWFTKSDQQQTRGVAKQGSRKYSSSVKTIIKNERALDLKRKVDKRLRKLAKDIYVELEGGEIEEQVKCWSCHKLAQREWKYCPRCGDSLGRAKK